MKIYDISIPIESEMPVYKGRKEKRPVITNLSNHKEGGVYESKIEMNLHTGTHLDAPLHMVEDGDSITEFEIEEFVVSAQVIDLTEVEDSISVSDLKDYELKSQTFILFKTKNSSAEFLKDNPKDFIYLDQAAADFLVEQEVSGVGIDALGIERNQPDHMTHKVLLTNGVKILEGINLTEVSPGEYTLICPPLQIKKGEASPVRAILLK
ncbi:cyclase family protein [Halanaerocella petrolearia]